MPWKPAFLALCQFLVVTFFLSHATVVAAAETLPPKPVQFFNDYAGTVSSAAAGRLNRQLEDFEKATSSQVVVAIFPKMQSNSSIEDYTRRVAEAWGVGQKERKNGAVLFVFTQDRKVWLQVGYGLEGAIPDVLAKRIIENEITPHFKTGDYDGGLIAGVNAILAASKGEYKGTGRTNAPKRTGLNAVLHALFFNSLFPWHFIGLFFLLSVLFGRRGRRGTLYDANGRRRYGSGWGWFGAGLGGGGGGGSSGGGGGGFSGGGGSFGGGGAGGSW